MTVKKKSIASLLDHFAAPLRELQTAQGPLFVYSVGSDTLKQYRDTADLAAEERGQRILPLVASQVRREKMADGIVPLPPEVQASLTDGEVAAVAEALRMDRPQLKIEGSDERLSEPFTGPREDGEPGYSFLARVVGAEDAAQAAQLKDIQERVSAQLGGTVGKVFADLQASSDRLGATVRSFDRQASERLLHAQQPMLDYQAQMARERREDREHLQQTSRMTAESATMLQRLVAAAQEFMLRVADRDLKADKQIRLQLKVTVASVVLGLVVSIVAAAYTMRSYWHTVDQAGSSSAAAEAAAAQDARIAAALEQNARLLQQNEQLLDQVRALAAATARAAASSPAPAVRNAPGVGAR